MKWLLDRLLLAVFVLTTSAYSDHLDTSKGSHSDLLSQSRHRTRSVLSAFRDTVIQTIWSIPETSDPSKQSSHRRGTGPPSTIQRRYAGDVVLRFRIRSSHEASALADAVNTLFLDVWEFTPEWVDIRLSKDVVPSLLGLLPPSLQHAHAPLMHDLAQAVAESYPATGTTEHPSSPRGQRTFSPTLGSSDEADQTNIFFRNYQPLSVITPWMRLLHSLFPTHVRMISVGTSYEGRDIQALRIGVHPTNSQVPSSPRETIIVTGGSHAREWISTSTVNYVAYSFITAYGRNKEITKLLEGFDWIFIPTLNPDGYVYSWQTDRLWRKNRQETSLRFCKGLDLDRSYGFEWDHEPPQDNPCSESFSGEAPFEGFEARRFANWARNETANNNVRIVAFLDLHSYSQQVLYPYSYSCASAPPTLENLEELALGLAKAIHVTNGETYGVTSACEAKVPLTSCSEGDGPRAWPLIESGGGSALDWFYHELKVKYSFQIKLRDTGNYGFLLPAKNIVPTGQEAFSAIRYMGDFLLSNKGIESEDDCIDKGLASSEDRVEKDMRTQRAGSRVPISRHPVDISEEREASVENNAQFELRRRRRR